MWKKVTTEGQLQDIEIGTVLKKYPIQGEPLPTFDEINSNNIVILIVSRNDNELQEIDFVLDKQKIEINLGMGLPDVVIKPFKVDYSSIIESGRYWIEE